jgi:hypothetical protein
VDVAARLNDLFPSGLTVHNDKELTWPAKGLTEAFHRWGESS